jgi:hypothetical protein
MTAPLVVVVNRHRVAANRRRTDGHRDPVFRISRGKSGKPTYAHQLLLDGDVVLVYSPDRPLPCGAHVWAEADRVRVLSEKGELVPIL